MTQRRIALALTAVSLLLPLLLPGLANAAGMAHDENFVVISPTHRSRAESEQYAAEVLAAANRFRREVALEWLGEEIPSGLGRTVLHVQFAPDRDQGKTWAIDPNWKRAGGTRVDNRRMHNVFLETSPELATGSTLKHEITHVILATRYPERLAAWIEEGIASRYDDPGRHAKYQDLLQWFVRTGNWPDLGLIVSQENISPDDAEAYAVASSVVDFLLSRGDNATLLEFAADARTQGWDHSLEQHYQLNGVADLSNRWRTWLAGASGN